MFSADNRRYIMRIPGEGTDQLINRKHEAEVFEVIKKLKLCDQPEYIDPDTGYKITRFLEDARPCNPYNWDEVRKCMDKLKVLHKAKIKVGHAFDIFGQIDFYEKLWNGIPSAYRDYEKTKDNILSLKQFLASQKKSLCLTHIDAIPDNFLFYDTPDGEELQLTDWEYAGMQDPHVDIAMFAIYSYYDKEQVDKLIDIYFDGKVEERTRIKIYCYIAMCGLLWSNWTEYKSTLGIEFGDYGLKQYRYAKEYYKYVQQYLQG
jgi:thiamine kinase-like enzyme